ncbi:MAG: hypothetical protein WEC17_01160 [Candidatus Saccharimonadales bacterium]
MGATRRLDSYDASLGWQPLFIVAGLGVVVIGAGIAIQALQLYVSLKQRKANLDTTGDPWNGRTLEWSTVSPPPFYNFAHIPLAAERDAFWATKQSRQAKLRLPYQPIHIPKNTPLALIISGFAFAAGFAVVWHIYWLAIVSFIAIIGCLVLRSLGQKNEYALPAADVAKVEAAIRRRYA